MWRRWDGKESSVPDLRASLPVWSRSNETPGRDPGREFSPRIWKPRAEGVRRGASALGRNYRGAAGRRQSLQMGRRKHCRCRWKRRESAEDWLKKQASRWFSAYPGARRPDCGGSYVAAKQGVAGETVPQPAARPCRPFSRPVPLGRGAGDRRLYDAPHSTTPPDPDPHRDQMIGSSTIAKSDRRRNQDHTA
jgi:hypothetical protein